MLRTMLAYGLLVVPVLAESDFEREYKDRLAIEKLMWQYSRALDTRDPEAYVAVFTPDGQFGSGPNATKGRDALYKMVADLKKRADETEAKTGKPGPAMYHVETNPYLEFVGKDKAILRSYWMTMFAGENRGDAARAAAVGWERNELVKVNGKWLIQVRDTAPRPE